MLTIVANTARNRRRAASVRLTFPLDDWGRYEEDVLALSPGDAVLAAERRRTLAAAVGRLPLSDREVITCRMLLDLNEADRGCLGAAHRHGQVATVTGADAPSR